MPRRRNLSLVRPATTEVAVHRIESAQDPNHLVILCGRSFLECQSLRDAFRSRKRDVQVRESLVAAAASLECSPGAVGVIAVKPANSQATVEEIGSVAAHIRPRLLVLASHVSPRVIHEITQAGVGDFLVLPASRWELGLRLRMRARVGESLPYPLSPGEGREAIQLTEREALVYAVLCESAGTPVGREEILARVWGRTQAENSSNVVDVYISYLRAKLARTAPSLMIESVRHVGYMLRTR